MKVRYIRESMNGSNANSGCHWCEIQAINYEGTNVALNKTVTCEGGTSEKGTLDMITNGNTTVDDYIYFRNDAQNTISVTVDLENVEELDNIKVWHYHGGGRTYKNILLEVSLDGVKWVEIFDSNKNGEYVEVEEGKTHELEDDRLPLLNETSSLSEVTSFYEKYVDQNILSKELLKNNLVAKGVECSDNDKMLSLIDRVGKIKMLPNIIPGNSNTMYYEDVNKSSTNTSYTKIHQADPFKFDGNYRIYTYHKRTNGASGTQYLYFKIIRNGVSIYTSEVFTTSSTAELQSVEDVNNVEIGDVIEFYTKSSAHTCVFTKFQIKYDFEY